jgi:hypothetical protein
MKFAPIGSFRRCFSGSTGDPIVYCRMSLKGIKGGLKCTECHYSGMPTAQNAPAGRVCVGWWQHRALAHPILEDDGTQLECRETPMGGHVRRPVPGQLFTDRLRTHMS